MAVVNKKGRSGSFQIPMQLLANMNNTLKPLTFCLLLIVVPLEAVKLPPNASNSSAGCIDMERKALLQFKEGLEDPSGRLSSWVGKNCCEWKGVGCSKKGNVVQLDLRNPYTVAVTEDMMPESEAKALERSRLHGKLIPSLLQLKYLHYLDLSGNNFSRNQIPSFIGSLRELKYLDLSQSSFTGMIPSHLGNLSNLQYLDLSTYTYFKSPIKKSIWISEVNWLSSLSSLKYLNLGNVNLSLASATWLQSVNMLPSLTELRLPSCDLRSFPQSLPAVNFSSLTVLDLRYNYFNSPFPLWLFNISTLIDLSLADSEIKGPMPNNSCGDFCNLQSLDLSSNKLSGEIIELIGGLSGCSKNSLEVFWVNQNNFTGQIPESLGYFVSLRSVALDKNSLSGSIPTSIGKLSLLEELDLADNKLNGNIPESIGQLKSLANLYLDGNSWEGVISEIHFLTLKNLRTFYLSSTNKSVALDVRSQWIPPFSLEEISISDCRIGPTFPAWLETQQELIFIRLADAALSGTISGLCRKLSPQVTWLDLSNNQLKGQLPLCSNIQDLILKNNLFSGPIPLNIGQILSVLTVLDLSGNFLNGKIPSSFSKIKNLFILSLSNNRLSGKIYRHWEGLELLDTLDLSKNNLSGGIPSSMCSLPSLRVMKLSSNNLSGNLSLSLQNCTGLSTLDIGDNKFSGKISNWIGESLLSLSILNLRANMFSGNIPEHICHFPNLHILDFAHNNLSGPIPPCLGNLSSLSSFRWYDLFDYPFYIEEMELNTKGRQLEYKKSLGIVNFIDLSSNNLQGEIPEDFKSLSYLGSLNLSWNQLIGKIPGMIGDLKLLETLDLSSNHLSGPIPSSMSSMTSLSHLNLSRNNLSGPIPSTNQFGTFTDPSIYEGNPELCGPPLPTNCSKLVDEGNKAKNDNRKDDGDWIEMIWFYSGMALGFVFGFWAVCGTLTVKMSWRHAYFRFADRVKDRMYVVIAVNMARLRRNFETGAMK